ncbi:MAG: hypothetical protein ACHQ49_12785 [Elusimicrobiota bacterium]
METARSKQSAWRRGGTLGSAIFIGLALLCAAAPVRAERAGTVGLDLNYPGVGVRYFIQNQTAIEGRGQFLRGTDLGGLRFYQYLTNEYQKPRGLDLFCGFEADYISFKGSSSAGSGGAAELFAGGEYFFTRRLSLQLDGGPAYITIKDAATSLGVSRFDVIINMGINLYFGRDFWSGPESDASSYSRGSTSPSKARNPDEVIP